MKKSRNKLYHRSQVWRCKCGEEASYNRGEVFLYYNGRLCKKCRKSMKLEIGNTSSKR